MRKLYQILASSLNAMENCREMGNEEWLSKHEATINGLVRNYMPSGCGFDNGTEIDLEASKGGEKLVFHTSFHHMNDRGMYEGWTDYSVTIKPCLIHDFSLKVSGRDRNEIKDYVAEAFHNTLTLKFEADEMGWKPVE